MIEEIDKKILELFAIYKSDNYDINKLFIDIHELICSYKTPIISYVTYNVDELKSYIKYKNAWEELYAEKEKPCSIEYMQDLEEKHGIEVE